MQTVCTIDILGLGPSIRDYKDKGNYKIGVNDIDKYHKVDCLVIADHHCAFSDERLDTVRNTTANTILSQNDEWSYLPGFVQIKLGPNRSDLSCIESDLYPYSVISPYIAAIHAYKMGAKRIDLYGVDMGDDYIKQIVQVKQQCVKDFYELRKYLNSRGVEMTVSSYDSLLSGVLPVNEDWI